MERGRPRGRQRSAGAASRHAPPVWDREPRAFAVTTEDDVVVHALLYGDEDAGTAVVFGHGFTGSQRNAKIVDLARRAAAAGVAFYTLDFRGHGGSGGHSTIGALEVHDLDAVVRQAREHHPRVVSAGASMGGFVALRHAGTGGDVDGVVSISSPAVVEIPRLPRAQVLAAVARSGAGRHLLHRRGVRVDGFPATVAAPIDLVGAIAPVPVAIVHGTRDRYVPLSQARALHGRLAEPRLLLVLPGFGHGEAGFAPPFATVFVRLVDDLRDARAGATRRATRPHDGAGDAAGVDHQGTGVIHPERLGPRG